MLTVYFIKVIHILLKHDFGAHLEIEMINLRVGELARLLKCSLLKREEGWGSIPQNPCKEARWSRVHPVILALGRQRQDDSWGLMGSLLVELANSGFKGESNCRHIDLMVS